MPSPHGAGGNNENLERLLVARHAAEANFKSMNMRETEFRKQKLVHLDKELQVRRIARERDESPSGDATMRHSASTPNKAGGRPVSGQRKTPTAGNSAFKARMENSMQSPHRCNSSPSFGSTWSPQSPSGLSVTRFAAALPVSNHPAIHPGAIVVGPNDMRRVKSATSFNQSGDIGSFAGASPGATMRHRPLLGESINSVTTWMTSPPASPDHKHHKHGFDATLTALFTDNSPSAPSSPAVRRERPHGFGFGRPDSPQSRSPAKNDPGYDDLWFKGGSAESEILDDDERDGLTQTASMAKKAEDREVIERLGGLMAILGPRYKTVSRDALWERARVGDTTPLQRQLARVGDAKKQQEADEKEQKKKAKKAYRKDKPVSVVEAPDDDPDGGPRAAWLVCRAREKERRDRQMQKSLGFLQLEVKE